MPKAYSMSWTGHPNYDWRKLSKGRKYRVTCQELGITDSTKWTKEASGKLANEWWARKKAELDQVANRAKFLDVDADGQISTPILEALDRINKKIDYASKHAHEELDSLIAAQRELEKRNPLDADPLPHEDDSLIAQKVKLLKQFGADLSHLDPILLQKLFGTEAVHADRQKRQPDADAKALTFGIQLDRWLEEKRRSLKPQTYRELLTWANEWKEAKVGERRLLHPEMDVKAIKEGMVGELFKWISDLKFAPRGKWKRWTRMKEFIDWLAQERVIERPLNLRSKNFKIKIPKKKVKQVDLVAMRTFLGSLNPRLQLYALLALNCGMTNVDMAKATHDMIDWSKGTLTRKRVKTEDRDSAPEVTYKLWGRTLDLLNRNRAKHPTLLLTSMDNTPLYTDFVIHDGERKGKVSKTDLISTQWERATGKRRRNGEFTLSLKTFRSIAATELDNHELFGRFTTFFLANSPTGNTRVHYAPESQELFDKVLSWLEGRLFDGKEKVKVQFEEIGDGTL